MKHMMIDLETLATSANAVVVSVGACVFTSEDIVRSQYWVLDVKEQMRKGRAVAPDTIEWWMRQSDQARGVFQTPHTLRTPLDVFATQFRDFFSGEPMRLWGNGADFDLAIMIDLFQRHGLRYVEEWKYYNHMCYRTFNQLFNCKNAVVRTGVHHHALDDAEHQARCVIASGKLKEFKL